MVETVDLPSYLEPTDDVRARFGRIANRPVVMDVRDLGRVFAHAFISIGLVISLLGALIAWVMLCVEILRLPAIDNVMPKALARENKHGAPANALWLTNLCVQALLLWTLANASTYTNLVYLATSLILLPYLWSAAYQVLLAVRGETYESGRGRTRDSSSVGSLWGTRCGWSTPAVGSTC